MRIRNQRDFWSGVMFLALGVLFVIFSQAYQLGTPARMGPGFFPAMLGALMALLGLGIGWRALSRSSGKTELEPVGWRELFLVLTSVTFCLFGFILGIWATGWEKLQIVPIMIITPLTFLGGSFYSINMLPPFWQQLSLFNPVVYLVNGFRWSFYGKADVSVALSLGMTLLFMAICLAVIAWVFRTGYRLKA